MSFGTGGKVPCLSCKQERSIIVRGVCSACHGRFAYQVRQGKTTWKRLLAEGKIAPKKRPYWLKEDRS